MPNFNLYDRDLNISPSLGGTGIEDSASRTTPKPEYGARIDVSFNDEYFYTSNYLRKKITKGANNMIIDFSLPYTNMIENSARVMIDVLERMTTGTGGHELNFNEVTEDALVPQFNFKFPTNIYKDFKNLSVTNYEINPHGGLYDINLSLTTARESPFFDWSGSSMLNTGAFTLNTTEIAPNWGDLNNAQKGLTKKFDIVYWTGKTLLYDQSNEDKTDNFWYAKRDSAFSNDLTDAPDYDARHGDDSLWSKKFLEIFTPDEDISISQNEKLNNLKFRNSMMKSSNISQNKNIIEDLTLNFSHRTDAETRALIHFLEKKRGQKPFEITLPNLYTKKKYFTVNGFTHTFVWRDCNDITVNLIEVVQPAEYIKPQYNFPLVTEGYDRIVTQDITGKYAIPEIQAGSSDLINFDTPSDHLVLEYGLKGADVPAKSFTLSSDYEHTGFLEFELLWTNLGGTDGGYDLDIHIIDPNGVEHSQKNTTAFSSNPTLSRDDVAEYVSGTETGTVRGGPEKIYYNKLPQNGTYTCFANLHDVAGTDSKVGLEVKFRETVDPFGFDYVFERVTGVAKFHHPLGTENDFFPLNTTRGNADARPTPSILGGYVGLTNRSWWFQRPPILGQVYTDPLVGYTDHTGCTFTIKATLKNANGETVKTETFDGNFTNSDDYDTKSDLFSFSVDL